MEDIYELRRVKRWSFTRIGRSYGITKQSARESYLRALAHIHERNGGEDLPEGVSIDDMYRTEELEYIEGVLERYMRLADDNEAKKPRTAIEALNGAHRYLDSLIRIKGINAPLKVQHTITNDALEAELLKIKSELLNVIDVDAEDVKQIDA